MSIDKALQDRVNTYGTNPAALQKRYQQSQKLIDLLALQQVKSDMQNARNSIMASMQNNPNTIAAQRENEVLGMAKEDVGNKVKQTAGVLNTKQRQQQAQMKKLMGLANKLGPAGINALMNKQSPQMNKQSPPVNPAMTGIARAPAQNMQGITRAAKGGIIGFQNTGYVPDLSMIPEEDRAAILQLLQGPESKEYKDKVVENYMANMQKENAVLPYPPEEFNNKPPTFNAADASSSIAHLVDTANDSTTAGSLVGTIQGDMKKDPLSKEFLEAQYNMRKDLIGHTPEQLEEFSKQYAGLKDLHAAQQDPGRLSKDRWRQMLLGAATRDNPGVGIMTGRGQALAQQDKAAQAMKGREINTYRDILGDVKGLEKDILTGAQNAITTRADEKKTAILAGLGLTEAQIDGLTSDQRAFYEDKRIAADKFMNAARITAEKAIQAASEENKLKIAQLQADVSRENNKLIQDTNREIRRAADQMAKAQILTNGLTTLARDKTDAIKNLRAFYKQKIDYATSMALSITGNRLAERERREGWEGKVEGFETEMETQILEIETTFSNAQKHLEAVASGLIVSSP